MAGAPKFGDAVAWAPRLGQGYDTLLTHALKGKGAMGPQGGGDFTDYEIGRAVVYMANKGGATFEEPKFVAGDAAAADQSAAGSTPIQAGSPAGATAAGAAGATGSTGAAAAPAAPVAAGTMAAQPAAAAVQSAAGGSLVAVAGGTPPALYGQVCSVCHAAGLAGAPKFGDKASWAPRLAQGVDGLTASAIKGKGAMPPKGGSAASEAEIKAVVSYMVAAAK